MEEGTYKSPFSEKTTFSDKTAFPEKSTTPSAVRMEDKRDEDSDLKKDGKSKQEASLRELIFDKASNTGMHGLPNAQRASSWIRKLFWLALVLAGLGKSAKCYIFFLILTQVFNSQLMYSVIL